MKLCYEPEHISLPKGVKVKRVAAVSPGVAIVTGKHQFLIVSYLLKENNDVYATQQLTSNAKRDISTGLYRIESAVFSGGEILDLGGQYVNRYAIVKN